MKILAYKKGQLLKCIEGTYVLSKTTKVLPILFQIWSKGYCIQEFFLHVLESLKCSYNFLDLSSSNYKRMFSKESSWLTKLLAFHHSTSCGITNCFCALLLATRANVWLPSNCKTMVLDSDQEYA